METEDTQLNRPNQKRGLFISIGVHILLLLLALLPLLTYPDPPPEKEGILVNFGAPDQGSGTDRPQSAAEAPATPTKEQATEKQDDQKEKQQEEASRLKPKEKMMTADNSEVHIKEQAEKDRQQSEAQKRAEAEAQRKAQEEAARKAREAKTEAFKNSLEKAFDGSGKGNTQTEGSQGVQNGDPNAEVLEGISTGKGKIGGGLSDRGVEYEPPIKDQSQKTGRVVMRVCVDASGKVTSADYTQRGSTTTDSDLKRIARKAALGFKFSEGELEKQCGTITIDFKVQ